MSIEDIPADHLCGHLAGEREANHARRAPGQAPCPTYQTRSYPEHDPQTEGPSPCPK